MPVATILIKRHIEHEVIDDYNGLIDCSDIDDGMLDLLQNKLRFRTNDDNYELIAVYARGSIVPDSVDNDTVCIDATIWFEEHSRELNKAMLSYNLAERFECYPQYVKEKDVVIFHLHPVMQNELEELQRFILPNAVVTILTIALLTSIICNCLLLMYC